MTFMFDGDAAFHTGIVVEDLAQSMEQFADVLGVRWHKPREFVTNVWSPEGTRERTLRFCYSKVGHPLELVEAVPGTIWSSGAAGLHHLGFWADDLKAGAAALEAAGMALAATVPGPDGAPTAFAYHRHPGGFYVELVGSEARPAFEPLRFSG
jgi:hypothetical protein